MSCEFQRFSCTFSNSTCLFSIFKQRNFFSYCIPSTQILCISNLGMIVQKYWVIERGAGTIFWCFNLHTKLADLKFPWLCKKKLSPIFFYSNVSAWKSGNPYICLLLWLAVTLKSLLCIIVLQSESLPPPPFPNMSELWYFTFHLLFLTIKGYSSYIFVFTSQWKSKNTHQNMKN